MEDPQIPIGPVSHVLHLAAFECLGCSGMITAEMWIPTARGNYVVTCVCGAEYRWTEGADVIRSRVPDDVPARRASS
jgi:hypothetical protein